MTAGTPMPIEFCEAVNAMVRHAAGEEICRAIDEDRAIFVPIWEAMTDEERACWVVCEEV